MWVQLCSSPSRGAALERAGRDKGAPTGRLVVGTEEPPFPSTHCFSNPQTQTLSDLFECRIKGVCTAAWAELLVLHWGGQSWGEGRGLARTTALPATLRGTDRQTDNGRTALLFPNLPVPACRGKEGDLKQINTKEALKVSQGNCTCFCKTF